MERVKVAIVGLGQWGPNMLNALKSHPRADVVAGVEISEARRRVIGENQRSLKLYPDIEQCLSNEALDAIVIAAPTELHYKLCMRALDAGKHVLVEKPLAHNAEVAENLVKAAEQRQLLLMTGHVFLFNQGVLHMKRTMDQGELGELLYLRSVRVNLGPIRDDVNALWDLAPHDISIFNFLYGAAPQEVSCTGFHLLGRKTEDIAVASLSYPNGRAATLFVSWLDPRKTRQITAVGTKRMLVFDDMCPERPITIYDSGVRIQREASGEQYFDTFQSYRMALHKGDIIQPPVSTGEPLKNECHHFIDCILEGRQPERSDGKFGLEVVRVLEALSHSLHDKGKPVSVW